MKSLMKTFPKKWVGKVTCMLLRSQISKFLSLGLKKYKQTEGSCNYTFWRNWYQNLRSCVPAQLIHNEEISLVCHLFTQARYLGYLLFPSTTLRFNTSCECQILQADFFHWFLKISTLSDLSDLFISICLQTFPFLTRSIHSILNIFL